MARRKHTLLIAIDYDGTIVDKAFPDVGTPKYGAWVTLRALIAAGHRLILWTCRENEPNKRPFLKEAVDFCKKNGVEFVSVNENRPEDDFRDGQGRKVYADLMIDDRNFGGFPGWEVIHETLLGVPLPDIDSTADSARKN